MIFDSWNKVIVPRRKIAKILSVLYKIITDKDGKIEGKNLLMLALVCCIKE